MPQRPVRSVIERQTPVTCPPETSVAEAAKLMHRHRVGALLVVEGERLRGIFTERDALFRVIAEDRDPRTTVVSEVMTGDPQTIPPDRPFGHALHMMFEGGFRHVPVTENGRPIGVVSARDALGSELQEFAANLETRERIGEILG
jgi:CBS domain-containing protein